MQGGRVKMWSPKGFGFIEPENGSKDQFVHISGLLDGEKELFVGDRVSFDVEFCERTNKNKAIRVRLL